jgi:hypothetical protein
MASIAAALHPKTKKLIESPLKREKILLYVGLVSDLRNRQQHKVVVDAIM